MECIKWLGPRIIHGLPPNTFGKVWSSRSKLMRAWRLNCPWLRPFLLIETLISFFEALWPRALSARPRTLLFPTFRFVLCNSAPSISLTHSSGSFFLKLWSSSDFFYTWSRAFAYNYRATIRRFTSTFPIDFFIPARRFKPFKMFHARNVNPV